MIVARFTRTAKSYAVIGESYGGTNATCAMTSATTAAVTRKSCLLKEKAPGQTTRGFFNPGNDLLSHPVSRAVPSAQEGLTSVFGMGPGVSSPP